MPRAAALVAVAAALLLLLPAPAVATTTLEPRVDRRLVLTPGHMCGTQGKHARGSAYEASLRSLATTVAAAANASPCNCSAGSVDRVTASAYCHWRPDARSPDCGACVALAFREAQRLCPYHMQAAAVVDGGACSVSFHEVQRQRRRRAEDARKIHDYSSVFRLPLRVCVLVDQPTRPCEHLVDQPRHPCGAAVSSNWTGLCCVAFLFLQEGRTRSGGPACHGDIDSNEYLSVPGDQ